MNEPSWEDAIKRSQASARTPEIKRFYKTVSVGEAEGGFVVLLDGRAARTPAKAPLLAPTRALALLLAGEWAAQGDVLVAAAMPITRLANSALDGVARTLDATREEIVGYAGSDLLCYRASEPETLVAMQRAAYDPVLAWAEGEFGARFALGAGVLHVPQSRETLAAAHAAIFAYQSPFAVAALHTLTSLSGSAVLALAIAHRAIGAAEAWRIAHVDEDFQIGRWGEDDEAARRREARWREFEAADATLAAL